MIGVRAGGVRIQGLIDVKLNFKRLPAVMPRNAVKVWSTVSVAHLAQYYSVGGLWKVLEIVGLVFILRS